MLHLGDGSGAPHTVSLVSRFPCFIVESSAQRVGFPPSMRYSPARIAFVFACVAISSGGQCFGRSDEFLVNVWKAEQGVPPGFVTGFAQSADGFLWMASEEGLARFDGVKFVSATEERFVDVGAKPTADTPGERDLRGPLRLFQAAGGSIFLSTGVGDLWRWNGKEFENWLAGGSEPAPFAALFELSDGRLQAITLDGRIFRATRRQPPVVTDARASGMPIGGSIQSDSSGGITYLTAAGNLVQVDASGELHVSGENEPALQRAKCLAVDAAGQTWIGGATGLYRGGGGHFVKLPVPENALPVKAILPAPDGSCWVGAGNFFWRYYDEKWSGAICKCPFLLPPYAGLVDRSSRLWLAPAGQGVWCAEPDGHCSRLDRDDGIEADATALFSDREGNLWAAPYRSGVACVRPRRFVVTETLADGQVAPVWTICQAADGAIWLGPEFAGASRLPPGLAHAGANSLANADDATARGKAASYRVWKDTFTGWPQVLSADRAGDVCAVAPRQGVFRFANEEFAKVLPWPAEAGYCSALWQDRKERWWLGSNLGLQSWQDDGWKNWGAAEGLPQPATHAITEDAEGRLWIGTYGGGLARLDGDHFTVFKGPGQLPSDSIYMLYPGADGSLWIGTDGGLGRWRAGRFSRCLVADGLPERHIVQIAEDGLGYLWLGTRDGLCRVSIASLDALDRGTKSKIECLVFDATDGIPSRTFQDRTSSSCLRATDGRLWFLTAAGVISWDPRKIVANPIAPSAVLERVTVDGHPRVRSAAAKPDVLHRAEILPPSSLQLDPGPHVLELAYTAASLAAGEDARFAYRLEGLDRDWVDAGSCRSAIYSFLPPGHYRFLVRAANHDGLWNPKATMLEITVAPHLWETRIFQVACALALAAAAGGGALLLTQHQHRRRLAQLELKQARESERTRIARDLHDDLGASLAEIHLLATSGQGQPYSPAKAEGRFQLLAGKTQTMVETLDAIVWAVDPRKDTAQGLVTYLRSYVEDYFIPLDVLLHIETPAELPDVVLSAEARHHVFLATKEAVHNVCAHSGARRVNFRIAIRQSRLIITLEDDGRGFDPTHIDLAKGNGLHNMKARLQAIHGQAEISSSPGAGVTVTIICPLPLDKRELGLPHL